MLGHMWFVLSRSKRHSFYPEHQTSPWHIWPLVWWMLWILPQRWSSWYMRLVTHFCFLLRLQISAVVTVFHPVCLHVVLRDLYLLPLCWTNDSNIYMDVILSRRNWVQCWVMEQCFWCRIHLWFRYVGVFVRKVDDVTAYLAAQPSRLRAHHLNITTTRWRLCVTMETLWQQQYGGYVVLLLLQMYSTSSTVQS